MAKRTVRTDSDDQREERAARVAEMMERARRHQDNAAGLQERVDWLKANLPARERARATKKKR